MSWAKQHGGVQMVDIGRLCNGCAAIELGQLFGRHGQAHRAADQSLECLSTPVICICHMVEYKILWHTCTDSVLFITTSSCALYPGTPTPACRHAPKIKCGRLSARVRISSPKSELAQANQGLVNTPASSAQNDSCMKPVVLAALRSIERQCAISASSSLVSARTIIPMGHT